MTVRFLSGTANWDDLAVGNQGWRVPEDDAVVFHFNLCLGIPFKGCAEGFFKALPELIWVVDVAAKEGMKRFGMQDSRAFERVSEPVGEKAVYVHGAGVMLQGQQGGPVERGQALAFCDGFIIFAGNGHFRLPDGSLVAVFFEPKAEMFGNQGAVMVNISTCIPSA